MEREKLMRYAKGLGIWKEKSLIDEQIKERRIAIAIDNERHQNSANSSVAKAGTAQTVSEIPVIQDSGNRLKSILENTPARFEISSNIDADGSKPLIEVSSFNPVDSGVVYNKVGAKYDLDPDWLKAIAYMENTHGYYDAIPLINLVGTSYRPMNVQYKTWKPLADQLGFTEWQVQYRVECNVELAALIIKRITHRVPNPTLEKVASIYNFIGRETVSDYGARVGQIYRDRLWEN